jgi:signal transduction histidine kinase/CheY-like chemotaxis protein
MNRSLSLRAKLISVIVGVSLVAEALAAAGFSWLAVRRYWQFTDSQVEAIGAIVADHAAPAIALRDRKAANELLSSLHAEPQIREAAVYSANGSCFASFSRSGGGRCPPIGADGTRRESADLVFRRGILADGERLGSLLLVAEMPSMSAVLLEYSKPAAWIVLLSLLAASLVAMLLQAKVSAPLLGMAVVAQRIAQTHRFRERVSVSTEDELGILAGSFNAMLDEIERRDSDLKQHRVRLEEQVAERSRVNDELRLAKEKAEEADRLKGEFLANMSHEIRTPMNGVVGMISLVLDRCINQEEREQLLVAQSAAQSLIKILNDILDLSKIEAGKMTLECISFDLRRELREVLRILGPSSEDKHLQIGLSFDDAVPGWVRGDPVRLRQVLVNLVGNAVKFTERGRVDLVAARTDHASFRFEIRDTGIGIPQNKLHAIFEAFTQADGSHTRRFGGTGLGLTITRRLVDLMGGRLRVESEPGKGSSFFVELPLEAAPHPGVPPALELARQPLPRSLEVLVAEDNPVNQKVILAMLRHEGWRVTLAANGREAYERFRERVFHLILMDIQMPEMDGLEATRLIRLEEAARGSGRTPILALTAHASDSYRQEFLARGMDGVITKPVTLATVLSSIDAVLRGFGRTSQPEEPRVAAV